MPSDDENVLHGSGLVVNGTAEANVASSSRSKPAPMRDVVVMDVGDSDDEPVLDEQRSTFGRRVLNAAGKRKVHPATMPPRPRPKPKPPPGPIELDDSDVEEVGEAAQTHPPRPSPLLRRPAK
eukprot:EG_transcript_45171